MPESTKERGLQCCTYSSESSAANDRITRDAVEEQVFGITPAVRSEIRRVEDGGTILVHITSVDCVDSDWSATLPSPIPRMVVVGECGNKARSAPIVPVDVLVDRLLKMNQTSAACGAGISYLKVAVSILPGLGSGVLNKVQLLRDVVVELRVGGPGATTTTTASHDAVTW